MVATRGVFFPLLGEKGFRWHGDDSVFRQSLLHLLLTEPGERVGRPTYGVGLRRYLFELNNVATRSKMREQIVSAIRAWEPRVSLASVDVIPDSENPNVVLVDVRYQTPQGRNERIEFPLAFNEMSSGSGQRS